MITDVLKIHHLRNSQSERIVWLCEELEHPYEIHCHERRADNRLAPDAYKALHPAGTAPVIVDGTTVLAESGAICDYIVLRDGRGRLVPAVNDADFPEHLFWFHWSNASYMATLLTERALSMTGAGVGTVSFVADRAQRARAMIEQRLNATPYFGGATLTTADIMMVFALTTMRRFTGGSLDGMPATRAYLSRIGERPAYVRAMDKAENGRSIWID